MSHIKQPIGKMEPHFRFRGPSFGQIPHNGWLDIADHFGRLHSLDSLNTKAFEMKNFLDRNPIPADLLRDPSPDL